MSRSRWLRGVLATVLMATGGGAWGQQAPTLATQKVMLDIPSQPIAGALTALGQQSGLTIMLAAAAKSGAISPAVVGNYTPDEALRKILASTGLIAEYLDPKTVKVSTARPAQSGESKATESPKGKDTEKHQSSATDVTIPSSLAADALAEVKVKIPEILIQGSRTMNIDIVRTEDDVQPYIIFDSQQIGRSGTTTVEEFLKQQLTMNTALQTNSQGFASTGGTTSSINLRGLGTNETLVLIDGRRSAGVFVNGNDNQPDINGIPLAAIERIEVLPSSASAIYGGAAVGGVVNIILKKNFDGGQISYTYDKPESSGANQRIVDVSYGGSFADGRTQYMIGGQYSDTRALLLEDRENLVERGISYIGANSPSYLYSASNPFQGAATNIASAATFGPVPPGTPGAIGPFGGIYLGSQQPNLTLRSSGAPLNSPITSVPPGATPGQDISGALLSNAGKYNLGLALGTGEFGLLSPFGTAPRTKSLFGTFRQMIFANSQLFVELSANDNDGRILVNPFSNVFAVPASAPTNPFMQSVQVTFPSTFTSPQTSESATRAATTGIVVPIGTWSTELDYTWSRNKFDYAYGSLDVMGLNTALAIGKVNPFVDTIEFAPDLSPYVGRGGYSGDATLNDVNMRAAGNLASLPAGRPTLTIGLEHRKEGNGNANFFQDLPLTPANALQGTYFGQSQSTNSVYAEAFVPLVSPKQNVPGAQSLDVQIAGRSERYTVETGTPVHYLSPAFYQNPPQGVHQEVEYTSTNPTVGIKYRPVADITFRASYSTAFLPPTAAQLLRNPTPACGAPCSQITDPENGRTYNVNFTNGGNPSLQPQTSKDWDFGLIFEPNGYTFAGLRVNLEYYKISQPNFITTPKIQQVVSDPALAGRVTRDPATGLISTVDDSYINATNYRTSGWDLNVDYRKVTAFGGFDFHLAGTVIKYDLRQFGIGSPFLDYAGFPADGGEAKIKANAALVWEYKQWSVGWTTTYYSSYTQYDAPGSPSYIQLGPILQVAAAQGENTIPSQTYHDLYLSYDFGRGGFSRNRLSDAVLSNVTIKLGVNNIFGSLPPFDARNTPYFYSYYGDPRLREYRASITKGF